MKVTLDTRALLGLFSATGLPAIFKAVIAFVHPSIYTLACGKSYVDGTANCYADDRIEAGLWLFLTLIAVAYGVYTFWRRIVNTPVATNTITVIDQMTGQPTTIASVNAPGVTTPPTPASTQKGP